MPYPTDFRRRHVRRAVVTHAFIDVEDWAAGLDELAGFTDAEIDALAQDEPSDPIIFEENVPLLGITPAHRQDRLATDIRARQRIADGAAASPISRDSAASELHASSRTLDQEERSAGVGVGDS
ncbi:MAG: hypothetical protein ABTQ27_15375 [Amaricoccus sp.]|uniref:hypothetical protein n=1 Tax=Amaricoccus sp. TaxID=1872485 RepID=UPI00331474C5